jgi:hypothetical protein
MLTPIQEQRRRVWELGVEVRALTRLADKLDGAPDDKAYMPAGDCEAFTAAWRTEPGA